MLDIDTGRYVEIRGTVEITEDPQKWLLYEMYDRNGQRDTAAGAGGRAIAIKFPPLIKIFYVALRHGRFVVERPTNQEVISKSRDTPIHRPPIPLTVKQRPVPALCGVVRKP